MNIHSLWTLTMTCMTLFLCGQLSASPVPIKVLDRAPALIDGFLTDACWGQVPETKDFIGLAGQNITEPARARFFCHGDSLYVGVTCDIRDQDAKLREVSEQSKRMKDAVEVFLDPGNTGTYVHFGISVAGVLLYKIGLCGPVEYGVQIQEKSWQVEMKIPFASLKLPAATFAPEWRMNLCRGNSNREYSSWSPLASTSFHDQAHFNLVTGIPCNLEQLYRVQKENSRGAFVITLDRLLYDRQKEMAGKVDLKFQQSMKGFYLTYAIQSHPHSKSLVTGKVQPVFFTSEFRIPIAALATGRYRLSVALCDRQGKQRMSGEKTFWKIPPKAPLTGDRFTIRDHTILRNGEFFFPIAIWSTSCPWRKEHDADPARYREAQKRIYRDIASLGINCMVNSLQDMGGEDLKDMRTYGKAADYHLNTLRQCTRHGFSFKDKIDWAKECGLYTVAYIPYLAPGNYREDHVDRWVTFMLKHRNVENILCYFGCDEADGAVENNHLRRRFYHEMDPEHLNYLNVINAVAQNKDAADILSTDPYPIPQGRVSLVRVHMERLLQNLSGAQSPWLWLQLGGGWGACTRAPRPEELRAMVYLSLHYGIRGIAYFTYQPPERRNARIGLPATYASLPELHRQVGQLVQMYLCGRKLSSTQVQGVDCQVIEHGGKVYLSAVSTSSQGLDSVALTVPGGKTLQGEVLFEGRKAVFADGILRERFAPYQVHIYELGR